MPRGEQIKHHSLQVLLEEPHKTNNYSRFQFMFGLHCSHRILVKKKKKKKIIRNQIFVMKRFKLYRNKCSVDFKPFDCVVENVDAEDLLPVLK